jgi:UDP-N-acetylglucosamine 2-epimerase (non-hydrolysing)
MHRPDVCLGVGSGRQGEQTAKIISRYEEQILLNRPDLVVVFGDVNSTVGCSLAASKLGVPIAHVESGLRSYDRNMPEEINRVVTDQLASLHFTTSPEAETNLRKEGIGKEAIFFVGNTMIDTLIRMSDVFNSSTYRQDNALNSNYVLITMHRPFTVDIKENLTKLVEQVIDISMSIQCVFPLHPRTKTRLKQFGLLSRLASSNNVYLDDSLGYIEFCDLQRNAAVVLTDSGGIQEETTYFGVSCLTVRENTERPVTIAQGTNKLIGAGYDNISDEVTAALDKNTKARSIPVLWDGKSGARIATIINDWMNDYQKRKA